MNSDSLGTTQGTGLRLSRQLVQGFKWQEGVRAWLQLGTWLGHVDVQLFSGASALRGSRQALPLMPFCNSCTCYHMAQIMCSCKLLSSR